MGGTAIAPAASYSSQSIKEGDLMIKGLPLMGESPDLGESPRWPSLGVSPVGWGFLQKSPT